ncbi:MAG: septum formation protein Maf [Bdellovibrionaceae bacterium]|nr:septum formation protein Maf [Pseudobdellovibrionaceae bacterium]
MTTLTLMVRFVLASKSPRRNFFLKKQGYLFHTFPVEISEILDENLSIECAVEDLALRKAQALVESGLLEAGPEYVILSADTIVYHQGRVLGKPSDPEDAFETLKSLSGKTHKVITAFCLLNTKNNDFLVDHEVSEVTFRALEETEIREYVATGDPMDKAGSYGIQSLAKDFTGGVPLQLGDSFKLERRDFVIHFTGSLENIAGLPIDRVEQRIAEKKWVLPKHPRS